jgi:hypothetical protein
MSVLVGQSLKTHRLQCLQLVVDVVVVAVHPPYTSASAELAAIKKAEWRRKDSQGDRLIRRAIEERHPAG